MHGEQNQPEFGLNSDHAYWVSGLTLRNPTAFPPIGKIDVMSLGFGVADPTPNPTQTGSGVYVGTTGPVSYTYQTRDWGVTPQLAVSNSLKIVALNIRTMTINPERAKIDCGAAFRVITDGPLDITLDGCGASGVHHFGN